MITNQTPLVDSIYQHYKGNNYKILALACHADTYEPYVVYQGLYNHEQFGDQPIWVRPLAFFMSPAVVDGKEITRFTKIK